ACLAQLVNVIAPIFTEPGGSAVKQTIYYPFELASRYGRGTALNLSVDCPGFENRHGTADYISASAVQTAEGGLTVFLTNYDTEAYDLELELHRLDYPKAVESIVIAEGKPEPQANNLPIANNGSVRLELAPNSYSMIRLAR
ncbi:MAG: hypothetical protein LBS19_07060, partial [Clostridiales bacterium]|nr:hypothetical protein [Clostridiales bacterium]